MTEVELIHKIIWLVRCPHRSYLTDDDTWYYCEKCDDDATIVDIGEVVVRLAPDGSLVADADGGWWPDDPGGGDG